jgi:hypothetical protein
MLIDAAGALIASIVEILAPESSPRVRAHGTGS